MAAGKIMMTPEEMHTYASRYKQSSSEITNLSNSLNSLEATIEQEWQGRGFDQFDAEFKQLKPKVDQFAQLLDEIGDKLNKSAQAMQDTDQQIASQFN